METENELDDRLMGFLCNGVELREQFALRYLAMKKFKESITGVLKHRKFPEIMEGLPPCGGFIEGQSELRDF